jgi:hypothetical protein
MTPEQKKSIEQLQADGFKITYTGILKATRGNDHRIIWRDGSVRRAMGAKK